MLVVINYIIVKSNNKQELHLESTFSMRPIDSKIIDSYIVDTILLWNNCLYNLNEIKYKCTNAYPNSS